MYREKKHIKFYEYCSNYKLKFVTTDIWDSPLLFTNIVLINSPTYHQHTTDIPPTYHQHTTMVYRWIYNDTVCKEQWWAPNICGEEFQCVGRTIFIKSKMILFPYKLIISTQIFKILTFLPSYNPVKTGNENCR